jgi:ribonuclease BN (tRNA processing enzyme)
VSDVTFVILGSGGWMSTPQRLTCSALLRRADKALLIDGGSGLAHLMSNKKLLAGVEELHIVLTHFHLDHIVGLGCEPGLGLPGPPAIHGPGRVLYGRPTVSILDQVLRQPTLHANREDLFPDVRDLPPDNAVIAGFELEFRRQPRHSAPTLGIRLGNLLAYCTDTASDPDTARFVHGVDILCHDAWWHAAAVDAPTTHASGGEAGEIAARAEAARLVLIHLHPRGGHQEVLREAMAEHGDVTLAADLQVITGDGAG